jgi:DNA polymerase I-like protein with 3'-5' exonuclease and polymerase domains
MTNDLYIVGQRNAPVLVICEPPDEGAFAVGDAMTDLERRFFASVSGGYDFTMEDFCFLPCAAPMPEDCVGDRDQSAHLATYREEFLRLFRTCSPGMVVTLGKHALRQVSGRAAQIGKARGRLADLPDMRFPVLPMSGVRQCLWFPENISLFTTDFHMIATLADNDYDQTCLEQATESNTDYRWTLDLSEILNDHPSWMAVDTETTGLNWTDPNVRVLTVQLTRRVGQSYVVPVDMRAAKIVFPDMTEDALRRQVGRAKLQLRKLLEDPTINKIGHNFKFDHHQIRESMKITVQNWQADTQQLAFVVDENMREKSLDEVTRRWVPEMAGYADAFNASVDKSKMLELLATDKDKFLRYAGGDTDANYRAARALMRLAQVDEGQWNTYRCTQLPALQAFADRVETTGLVIDRNRLAELQIQIERDTKETHTRVLSEIPAALRREHLKAGLSLTRRDLVADALFGPNGLDLTPVEFTKGTRHKTGDERIPSTSAKTHLIYFASEPLVDGIMRWSKLDKMRTTYVGREHDTEKGGPTGFWQHLVRKGENWRIYPSFFLHRTVTGRTSSSNPNAQNFPKRGELAKAFRSIFVAPPGYKIIEADLSQAELRIAACEANEQNMIRLYREGVDIHANTACAVSGNDLQNIIRNKKSQDILLDVANNFAGSGDFLRKLNPGERRTATVADFIAQLRYQAKAVNFGFLYGMQWRGFKTYAKVEYGVEYTEQESMAARDNFFDAYPGLLEWHNAVERFVYTHGYVRSLHGAVRHLPSIYSIKKSVRSEAVRQAINSPVQRFASDLGITALWRMCRDAPQDSIMPVAFIHDALVMYVREDMVQEAGSAVRFYMENNPLERWYGLQLPLPIVSDVSVGDRLSEMEEVKMPSVAPAWYNAEADLEPNYVMRN